MTSKKQPGAALAALEKIDAAIGVEVSAFGEDLARARLHLASLSKGFFLIHGRTVEAALQAELRRTLPKAYFMVRPGRLGNLLRRLTCAIRGHVWLPAVLLNEEGSYPFRGEAFCICCGFIETNETFQSLQEAACRKP